MAVAAFGGYQQTYFGHVPVSDLKRISGRHDTDRNGLLGIWRDDGFRSPFYNHLLWWSLDIGHHEITSAAQMPMMTNTGELATMKPEDLEKFATSPAFQESSRYGAYGFTFPLQKVLQAYKQQCCFGHAPIMRAFRTQRINEEVMYVVLVHRPWDEWRYSDTPRLTDTPNPVCAYRNGHIIWRARAMCKTHKWGLNYSNPLKLIKKANPKDYVWDHVSVALDVGYQVLRFNYYDLGYSLKFCSRRESFIGRTYDEPRERDNLVRRLWPTCPALEQSAQVEEMGRLFQNFVL